MKKKTIYFAVLIMLAGGYLQAVEIFGGGFFGTRSLNESSIKDMYDNGGTYLFAAGAKHMGIFGELGFSGFKRGGESTEYSESSEFSLWDVNNNKVTRWYNLRPSCWLSTIAADGMLILPEGGGGCSCGNWLETSLAFSPLKQSP